MASEREFAQIRFVIVKERLEDPNETIARLDRIRLEREYRLLGKILHEVEEDKVLRALKQWRVRFGQEWHQHKVKYREEREVYNHCLQLLA